MKKLLFLFFIISGITIAQSSRNGNATPTFNGCKENLSDHLKYEDICFKTQEFISNHLSSDFIEKHFNINDSIEFNFEYVITKLGEIRSVKINTKIDFFNKEIKSILYKLPKFKPALAPTTNVPDDFYFNYSPEYYISEYNKFIPIYRKEINQILKVNSGEKDILDIAKNIGYTKESQNSKNTIFFSLTKNKKIKNLRIYSEHSLFAKKLKNIITDSILVKIKTFPELVIGKNYSIPVNMYFDKKFGEQTYFRQELIITNKNKPYDTPPIYPGCENEKNNTGKESCMSKKINKFIVKKFDTSISKHLRVSGKLKISVFFNVNKEGDITEIKVRAPHLDFEKEAKRVINLLPKMVKPAYHNNKPITITYFLPISFNVEKSNNNKTHRLRNINNY